MFVVRTHVIDPEACMLLGWTSGQQYEAPLLMLPLRLLVVVMVVAVVMYCCSNDKQSVSACCLPSMPCYKLVQVSPVE